jgi:hypothetical protein
MIFLASILNSSSSIIPRPSSSFRFESFIFFTILASKYGFLLSTVALKVAAMSMIAEDCSARSLALVLTPPPAFAVSVPSRIREDSDLDGAAAVEA